MKLFFKHALVGLFFLLPYTLLAQEDTTRMIIDDIQIDVKSVVVNPKTDTLSIELFLISYQMNPREFKLNTFATQVQDKAGEKHMYTTMKLGRVLIDIAERQNYLHYLFEEDEPVLFQLKIANWKREKPEKLVLVFEDSQEEGKFIQQEVEL